MQNSSHQNDFGWNTFFAKDVTDDVQNDTSDDLVSIPFFDS